MSVDDSDESLEETEEFSSLLSIEGTVEEPLLLEPVEEEEEVLKEESSLLLELRLYCRCQKAQNQTTAKEGGQHQLPCTQRHGVERHQPRCNGLP
jgi:hypothetical protein